MTEEHSLGLQPGTIIAGKYEVVRCLGAGSMGLVYACRNRVLGQIVAVKVLFPEVASDKIAAARFKNEILASYEVSHPNVVRAYDYISERDLVAYSMEYVGGGDLASKLGSDERMPISQIVRMLSQMAAGCQAIHDAGIVHRDLKPENILLTSEGSVKIADFGIARNRHGPKLTEHGGVVGTIDYVAPEYMLRSQVDWRSDIYALGILAYEMVTGESPFQAESVYATMTKRLKTDPEPPSRLRSECPPELDQIILKAMQREPEKRYQAAREMFTDLQKVAEALGASTIDGSISVTPTHVSSSADDRRGTVETFDPPPRAPSRPPQEPTNSERAPVMASTRTGSAGIETYEQPSWNPSPQGRKQRNESTNDVLNDVLSSQRQVSGTEVLSDALADLAVEPRTAEQEHESEPEPSVPTHVSRSIGPRGATSKNLLKRHRMGKGQAGAQARDGDGESRLGEILALCFAAAVGIGCGFLFIKFFAPSLLEQWN